MQQVVKEAACDYNTFIDELTVMVKEMMGEEYTTQIYKVTKNNSLELDSLVIRKEGKNFAPNIYLLPYYEAFAEGTSILELAGRLCDIYHNSTAPLTEQNLSYTFEDVKQNIVYRLVSYDKNRKLLDTIPHIRYLDLAVTFHCLVHDDEAGIGTIRITNEHLDLWDTTLMELRRLAANNTKRIFPPVIRSMEEVIKSMLAEEYSDESENNPPEKLFQEVMEDNYKSSPKMYILSNRKGINGAACLIYDNILQKFSEKIKSDFYILPSSIHEVILVPYEKTISKDALTEMVKDVNRTQVAADEILSDKVYYYSRENNAITM